MTSIFGGRVPIVRALEVLAGRIGRWAARVSPLGVRRYGGLPDLPDLAPPEVMRRIEVESRRAVLRRRARAAAAAPSSVAAAAMRDSWAARVGFPGAGNEGLLAVEARRALEDEVEAEVRRRLWEGGHGREIRI